MSKDAKDGHKFKSESLTSTNLVTFKLESCKNPSEEINLTAVNQCGNAIKYIENPSEKIKLAIVNEDRISISIKYTKNPYFDPLTDNEPTTEVRNSDYVSSTNSITFKTENHKKGDIQVYLDYINKKKSKLRKIEEEEESSDSNFDDSDVLVIDVDDSNRYVPKSNDEVDDSSDNDIFIMSSSSED